MVALRIAKEKKPHTIAEKLILPCCKDIVRCMIGESAEKKLVSVPLSNNTIQRRISEMAEDIKEQVVAEIQEAPLKMFAIQLDESTEVANCAQLLVFARYIKNSDFKEEFLFCHALEATTKGEDVYQEVPKFFEKEGLSWDKKFSEKLLDEEWLLKLAYLNDIFGRLNMLNKSLQGQATTVTVIEFVDKLKSFIVKLDLWKDKVCNGRLDVFENLCAASEKNPNMPSNRIQEVVQEHLSTLKKEFQSYVPDLSLLEAKLIRSPFNVDASLVSDDIQEEFVDLINDSTARDAFETLPLIQFWSRMSASYTRVAGQVVKSLLVFPSTYLCEQVFSSLCLIKTKHRAKLAVEADLRVALSKTVPQIVSLAKKHQAQPSH